MYKTIFANNTDLVAVTFDIYTHRHRRTTHHPCLFSCSTDISEVIYSFFSQLFRQKPFQFFNSTEMILDPPPYVLLLAADKYFGQGHYFYKFLYALTLTNYDPTNNNYCAWELTKIGFSRNYFRKVLLIDVNQRTYRPCTLENSL